MKLQVLHRITIKNHANIQIPNENNENHLDIKFPLEHHNNYENHRISYELYEQNKITLIPFEN